MIRTSVKESLEAQTDSSKLRHLELDAYQAGSEGLVISLDNLTSEQREVWRRSYSEGLGDRQMFPRRS